MKRNILLLLVCCLGSLLPVEAVSYQLPTDIPEGAFPVVYRGHLYITGLADNVKGRFIFDTGARNFYFDDIFYTASPFHHEKTINGILPGAGTKPQQVKVVMDTVSVLFGNEHYKTTMVPIFSLKPIVGDYADGIIGMDYFRGSLLEISYERGYMKVLSGLDSLSLQEWTRIPLTQKNGNVFMPLEVKVTDNVTVSGLYLVDIGFGGSIHFTSTASAKYALPEKIAKKVSYYTQYGGVGGTSSDYTFVARQITIGGFTFQDLPMQVSQDKSGALASDKHNGLIGNDILERFDVIFDFKHNQLYLKPNQLFGNPFPLSRLGFTYVDRSQTLQSWVVSGFYADSPAEQSGLRIDDRIVSINGTNVCDIAYEERGSFFRQYDSVTLDIRRGEDQLTVVFDLKSIL